MFSTLFNKLYLLTRGNLILENHVIRGSLSLCELPFIHALASIPKILPVLSWRTDDIVKNLSFGRHAAVKAEAAQLAREVTLRWLQSVGMWPNAD